jgi:myo-inositol 2-dehydrogenase / D-chiro-inositol 1-dehydrogenase
MSSFEPVRFGLIGSGWITKVHLDALRAIPNDARVVACADYPRDRGRPGRGEAFAREHGVAAYHADYRRMLEDRNIEAVTVALPNVLHAEVALAALEAGKHVIIEKPLCFTLEEAERIVRTAKSRGLVVGYAEELCYSPKLVRGKSVAESGAIGRLLLVKQIEAHAGPYSDWFFDPALAGGGALMDMGCHSIEYARWMFGKAPVRRVTAKMSAWKHVDRGPVEDHCFVHLELDDGRAAMIEAGWTLQGGMDSIADLVGTDGVMHIDMLKGNGMSLYSVHGNAKEEVGPGWSFLVQDWLAQNGYPQEMQDFARAIREKRTPIESGEDGRAVLEIIWAAYASAAQATTISLPYAPPSDVTRPVDLWLRSRAR